MLIDSSQIKNLESVSDGCMAQWTGSKDTEREQVSKGGNVLENIYVKPFPRENDECFRAQRR